MLRGGRAMFRTVSLKNWRASGGDGSSVLRTVALPNLKRKASNSWSAIQDTYLSTKQVFEQHRVVFTVGTSIASILTAWAGYSIRHIHQTNVEKRLGTIEEAMKKNYSVEREEIKKIVGSGNVSTTAWIATAGTTLIIGYCLGWRGGSWFATRKFRREQLKLMGQIKPNGWQLLRRPFIKLRSPRTVKKHADLTPSSVSSSPPSKQIYQSC